MSLFRELQKRKVFRTGAAYVVVAWLLIQVADAVLPTFDTPAWVLQTVIFLLILGFPLSLVLAWVFEFTPDGIRRDNENLSETSDPSANGRSSLDKEGLRDSATADDSGTPGPKFPKPDPERLPNSVAVLPFANLTPNPDDSFFAAGIHDEILNQLVKISSLNVIARTSVLQYADVKKSVREIARELNVEKVMEGNIRFSGNRVRVTAQLIDSSSGMHIWSETYERQFDDIFGIESDVAIKVAEAMQAAFSLEERRQIEQIPTRWPAAYNLYLHARQILYTGGGKYEQAHDLLDRAIKIDPQFARAYGLKALLFATAYVNTDQHAGEGAMSRAFLEEQIRLWSDKAFALEPKNGEARSAIRTKSILTWHWPEFDQALEPGDEARLYNEEVWLYSWRGLHGYAIQLGEKIRDLNPNDPRALFGLGVVYAYAGKYPESNRVFRKVLDMIPDSTFCHTWLAFNAIATGATDRALELLQLEEKLLGDDREIVYLPDLAYCYSRIGQTEEAARILEEIHTLGKEIELGAGTWATAYLASGDEEKAVEQLEIIAAKARNHEPDHGFLNVMTLRMNHLADPVLDKPEFVEVFSRITGD